MIRFHFFHEFAGAIWRIIVHDDHAIVVAKAQDFRQQTRDVLRFVVGADYDDAIHVDSPARSSCRLYGSPILPTNPKRLRIEIEPPPRLETLVAMTEVAQWTTVP